ncbi:MAG: hypothetical protein CL675_13005 [Bdellovibrionaceae bacterium]|nr:hypothetical protein [Pseudobdellovibrionaceae bacterium]
MIRFVWVILFCLDSAYAQSTALSAAQRQRVKELTSQSQKRPSSALPLFNLGVIYYQAGQKQKSLQLFDLAMKHPSELAPVIQYYQAQIHYELGDLQTTTKILDNLAAQKLPNNLTKRIQNFRSIVLASTKDTLAAMAKDEPSQTTYFVDHHGYLNLTYGLNTNPIYETDSASTGEDVTDEQTQTQAGVSATLFKTSNSDLRWRYDYFGRFYDSTSSADYFYNYTELSYSFFWSDYRLRLSPRITFDSYAAESFAHTPAVQIDVSRRANSRVYTLGYRANNIQMVDDDFSYLGGQIHRLYVELTQSLESWDLAGRITWGDFAYDNASNVVASYDSIRVAISAVYRRSLWKWSIAGYYDSRIYDGDAELSEDREDANMGVWTELAYQMGRTELLLQARQTENISNFSSSSTDRNYSQTVFATGFSWNF